MPTENIEKLVGQINEAVVALKGEQDQKSKADEQRMDRISKDLTETAEKLQKAQAEKAEMEKRMDSLEAAMSRADTKGGEAQKEEFLKKQAEAMDSYLRDGILPEGFKLNREGGIEVRALSTEVDPEGGYLVRPELANFVATRVFETSPMRQLANIVPGSSKSLTILLDDDEPAANNTGEGSASSDTDTPDVAELEIFAHKYDAEPQATVEMLADAYLPIEQWLQGKVADKIGRKENTDFITGNGVGKCRGILSYSAWATVGTYERNKVDQIALGNSSALTSDGLIGLQNALAEEYQMGASWLMHRTTFGAALKLKSSGGGDYLFSPNLLRDGQNRLELLGKPVTFAADVPVVASNALAVVYADFKRAYTIYDRQGLIVVRDPYTNKGRVKFYTSRRTGGAVTGFDAIKIGKVST